ncbi:GNAT family N-acetyltransferase [Cloacibacillus porcorum]|uniref:GNAT family N-acetyltransferase n=1 Tax=Cloacibacillus porcorum TaxID=1197717 RepID=UPI00258B7616|nr:GNAT family N-acetyltransferase [Cloacibacillus porcorum]MDD7648456.1 GNAT family N-acetyltransferase [Cloacibacillus porcorum]MDY4093717.1 GNAT family N-acetyltransferase [Cloacibacillus porcorum]
MDWVNNEMLLQKSVNRKLKEYREIVDLMKSAFPPEERLPVWWLVLIAKTKDVHFYAFYDDDRFCGITYTIETENLIFLLYFAVSDRLRSNGYGSQIIDRLKDNSPEKEIILNVEKPDITADNFNQRVRRIVFYERNNFYVCNFILSISGIDYNVLSTKRNPNIKEFGKIVSRYCIGHLKKIPD